MYDYIDKLDEKETQEMFKEIDKNYRELNVPIPKPIYDKNGEWKNEKEVKSKLKKILPILLALWWRNKAIIEDKSKNTIRNNLLFYSLLKVKTGVSKTMITTKEWTSIQLNLLKKRQKKIKINQVIRGNARVLNKQVQKLVNDMYRNGKSYPQTARKLQQLFGYNKNKAKSIAITEKNFYKSEAQLEAIKNLDVKKVWVHNKANEPRPEHVSANGQVADNRGYFNVGGLKTKAPQHFGIPSQDINCHCTMKIELKNNVRITKEEIEKAITTS